MPFISFLSYLARALGFEPRSKVLETSILPLNYARVAFKFDVANIEFKPDYNKYYFIFITEIKQVFYNFQTLYFNHHVLNDLASKT